MNYQPQSRQTNYKSDPVTELNKKLKATVLTINDTVNPELLKTYAEKYGKLLGGMSSTQLRKFYDEVVLLEKRIIIDKQDFKIIYPSILMLHSKLAYAAGKEKNKGKKESLKGFMEFMKILVDKVDSSPEKGKQDFRALKLFFEAVVGYYTFHNK